MSDLGAPFHQRHAAALGFLLFAALAFASPVLKIYADRNVPLPADLTPGGRAWMYDRGYAAPCPLRRWSEGEFLPTACIDRHDLRDTQAISHGLGPNYLMSLPREGGRRRTLPLLAPFHPYRFRYWVKVGPDALLVAGHEGVPGQVLKVVRERFPRDAFPVNKADQAADFRRAPTDYVQATRSSLWANSLVLGLIAFAFGVWGVSKRLFSADA